jgi:hypothetical protein
VQTHCNASNRYPSHWILNLTAKTIQLPKARPLSGTLVVKEASRCTTSASNNTRLLFHSSSLDTSSKSWLQKDITSPLATVPSGDLFDGPVRVDPQFLAFISQPFFLLLWLQPSKPDNYSDLCELIKPYHVTQTEEKCDEENERDCESGIFPSGFLFRRGSRIGGVSSRDK